MCGRKTLTQSMKSIIEELAIDDWQDDKYKPSHNIAPTQSAPILIGDNGSRVVKRMQWGLIPSWSKDESIGSKMINARAETLLEKPSFQDLVQQNHCIIITDGYFEWKRGKEGVQPYYFRHPKNRLLLMAGLWTSWTSLKTNKLLTYTVITTSAKKEISYIHNRMPVILNPTTIDEWIFCDNTSISQTITYLTPYTGKLLTSPVSTYVNSPKNNSPECIRGINDTSTLELF